MGARFFIENFKRLSHADSLLDLGCGNGVLGIKAKVLGIADHISFVDESYMAIDSAKNNYLTALGNLDCAEFYQSESLSQVTGVKPDIILCNPPFHQQHQVGDYIAKRMFTQSAKLLNPQGELWIVANRHLNYQPYLKQLFKQCITVASNNKFNIYKASKPL
ncbi:MAG: 16S rRNA G1207 methylase RsmC [Pseudohongiellaceae bacterium]